MHICTHQGGGQVIAPRAPADIIMLCACVSNWPDRQLSVCSACDRTCTTCMSHGMMLSDALPINISLSQACTHTIMGAHAVQQSLPELFDGHLHPKVRGSALRGRGPAHAVAVRSFLLLYETHSSFEHSLFWNHGGPFFCFNPIRSVRRCFGLNGNPIYGADFF
jgi:hypothetical protein